MSSLSLFSFLGDHSGHRTVAYCHRKSLVLRPWSVYPGKVNISLMKRTTFLKCGKVKDQHRYTYLKNGCSSLIYGSLVTRWVYITQIAFTSHDFLMLITLGGVDTIVFKFLSLWRNEFLTTGRQTSVLATGLLWLPYRSCVMYISTASARPNLLHKHQSRGLYRAVTGR